MKQVHVPELHPTGVWFPQGFANLYHAQADIRRGDTEGRYRLVSSHPHPQFVGLQASDVALVEPKGEREFLNFAIRTIRDHNVKVIVPSRRQPFFHRHAELLSRMGANVLTVASTRTLTCIENKVALYRHLSGKNIVRIPAFAEFKTVDGFDHAWKALTKHHETLCVKPAYGVYGSGFRVLTTRRDRLRDLLSETLNLSVSGLRARLRVDAGASMMLMQYLAGDERSVDCLAQDGRLLAGVVRRKSASAVAGQVIEDHPEILAQVSALTRHLRLNGLFNVQFKDHDGQAYLLEINPRMSGRSYYATVAGCNLPYLACELFSGAKQADELLFTVAHGMCIGNINSPVVLEGVQSSVGESFFRDERQSA